MLLYAEFYTGFRSHLNGSAMRTFGYVHGHFPVRYVASGNMATRSDRRADSAVNTTLTSAVRPAWS